MTPELAALLDDVRAGSGKIVALTGAGISAESGIPTFRGEEGYWTVGSRVYQPQEMATMAMFRARPDAVWPWYLWRRAVCRQAQPNPAHASLVTLEERYGERFRLVTQNVDGLHLRAGNSMERTWQIHGNIDYMRCLQECSSDLYAIPTVLDGWTRGRPLDEDTRCQLTCPRCGASARPHVLWFDEMYDEARYRFESSLRVSAEAELLLIVGTAGATNLPNHMVSTALRTGAAIVDINPQENVFAAAARRARRGAAVTASAGEALPSIVEGLTA